MTPQEESPRSPDPIVIFEDLGTVAAVIAYRHQNRQILFFNSRMDEDRIRILLRNREESIE